MSNLSLNYKKKLLRLSWPIFIESLLFMLLGSVDTFMLSKYSDNSVAAVGVSNQLIGFINLTFAIITTGTAILCAQYIGAKDNEKVSKVSMVSLIFNGFLGVVLSLALVFFAKSILNIMNIGHELMDFSKSYLIIVGGASFAQALSMTVGAILRSQGYTKITMYITIGVNILNIIGDYALIFGKLGLPSLGVTGAALSTAISKIVALIIAIYILFKYIDKNLKINLIKPFPVDILKQLLKIGVPSAGEQIAYNTSQIAITYFINMIGVTALTTKAYVSNIVIVTFVFSVAIAQGTSILVGNLVGKEEKEKAYTLCFYSLKLSTGITFILSTLCIIFSKPLLGIFTSDPNILSLGFKVLVVDWFLEFGRMANIIIINSLRAAGDVKFPVYCGIVSMWGISVVMSHILGIKLGLGLVGVWISFAMDEIIRGILMYMRWKTKKWQQISLIYSR
ncbi:MATE family efflux transporter [Clostridium fallax]|uniref:Putative efflux protein, MATE family n=1 Tax=Clostridium fallax TaxID=1533 RepID=A0A1M4YPJ9_9CLOT|nr:MATE family efflux transporter [Clostridium fallax]SHF07749.1 putative efflux protein, MATE family [Clostridium fallax]SQB07519.1 MATE efflux family protein [Clostridium fallax]